MHIPLGLITIESDIKIENLIMNKANVHFDLLCNQLAKPKKMQKCKCQIDYLPELTQRFTDLPDIVQERPNLDKRSYNYAQFYAQILNCVSWKITNCII